MVRPPSYVHWLRPPSIASRLCQTAKRHYKYYQPHNFCLPTEPIPSHPRPSGPKAFGWGHQVEEVIKDPVSKRMIVRSGLILLHFAAAYGAVGVLEVLLRHGANPAAEDSNKASPARIAMDSVRLRYQPKT